MRCTQSQSFSRSVPLLCACRTCRGLGDPRPISPSHTHACARTRPRCCSLGTWFLLPTAEKSLFQGAQRHLAEDQIAAPLRANSRLSEGVNISQRVTSVLFITNIFSLLSGDLPTRQSPKTSPRPRAARLRLSSLSLQLLWEAPNLRGLCREEEVLQEPGITPCSFKPTGHPGREALICKRCCWVGHQSGTSCSRTRLPQHTHDALFWGCF